MIRNLVAYARYLSKKLKKNLPEYFFRDVKFLKNVTILHQSFMNF